MLFIEKLLKAIPYLRRPYFQRDAALAHLEAAKAELIGINAKLAIAEEKVKYATRTVPPTIGNSFDPQRWFLLPDQDARQDEAIGDLRTYVARMVSKDCESLEIGPSFAPILPKSAGYAVTIVDHADQAELVEKYATSGVDLSKIEPVDIVWDGHSIAEATGHNRFDAIVAAHVIEHAPDLIQFFVDCSNILRGDGSIYLLVPDKRYTFDFMQPLSDVAGILGIRRAKRTRHSFESLYRLSACVRNGERIAWDQSGISELVFAHGDPSERREFAERCEASSPYVDVHENYFTPVSFAMIVDELRYLGEIDLELTLLTRPRGCEFLAVLRKADRSHVISTETFLRRKMDGYRLLLLEEQERIHSASRILTS
jgi:2-polyprenyl-3-methyl-5-hydroxy-6-metoxy-1,4-benzoquinol methylase